MNYIAHSFQEPLGQNSTFTNNKENISRGVAYWTPIQGRVYFYASMRDGFRWFFSSWSGIWCTCVYCKCYKDAHPHESMLSSYSHIRQMRGVTHRGLCYHESTDEHGRAQLWYQNNRFEKWQFLRGRFYFVLSVIVLDFYNFFRNISFSCFWIFVLFSFLILLFYICLEF